MYNFLNIGIIQTHINACEAWRNGHLTRADGLINMEYGYEEYIWQQIIEGFTYFKRINKVPDIIIAPELTIPLPYKINANSSLYAIS